jgi:hypothetical protein
MGHHEDIKQAILEGDTVQSKDEGWTILINASDEVEVWPARGKGFITGLAHLDTAVTDFCRKAEIPVPGVNEQQPDAVDVDAGLDPDSETDSSLLKEPKVQTQPKSDGYGSSDMSLDEDTETNDLAGMPSTYNERPKSQDYGFSNPNLNPDTDNKEMGMGIKGNKFVDTFSEPRNEAPDIYRELRAKRPSEELLNGIMDDPESWAANNTFHSAGIEYDPAVVEQQSKGPVSPDESGDTAEDDDAKGRLDQAISPDYKLNEKKPYKNKEKGASRRQAGPKLKERWMGDGGYSRDIEAETPEELHNLTRAFGGEDGFEWPAAPTMHDDLDQDEAMDDGGVVANKSAVFEDMNPEDMYGMMAAMALNMADGDEVLAKQILDQNISEAIDRAAAGGSMAASASLSQELTNAGVEVDYSEDDLYFPRNQASTKILKSYPEFEKAAEVFVSDVDGGVWYELTLNKEAVDESAKEYWSKYFGDYGKDLTKDDVPKKKDKKNDDKKGAKEEKDDDKEKDKDDESDKESASCGKKSQVAPTAPAPAPAAPAPAAPAPGGGAAPAPKSPAPAPGGKAPGQTAPGTGDAGLQAIGLTPEEIQGLSDEAKQKILQAVGGQGDKAPAPGGAAPKAPAPGGQAPPAPAAPAPAPAAPAPAPKTQAPVAKRSQAVPEQPAPAAPAPAAPAPAPMDTTVDINSPEEQAFSILQEVQDQDVSASSPDQIKTIKAQILAERMMKEIGYTPTDASKLFGEENLMDLFKK